MLPADAARQLFAGHRFKLEIIDDASTDDTFWHLQAAGVHCLRTGINRLKPGALRRLLSDLPGFVFTAGDNAYGQGTPAQFANCYDPGWGAQRERTFPALGNHDAETAGAAGYFDYFGARAGDPRAGTGDQGAARRALRGEPRRHRGRR